MAKAWPSMAARPDCVTRACSTRRLSRPLHPQAHAEPDSAPDVAALAAGHTVGLARNHPFVDGNKRAAFLATGLFFYLNGYRLNASQADATLAILAVASGELNESGFADWLRNPTVPG